jgi:hypothetical protein
VNSATGFGFLSIARTERASKFQAEGASAACRLTPEKLPVSLQSADLICLWPLLTEILLRPYGVERFVRRKFHRHTKLGRPFGSGYREQFNFC